MDALILTGGKSRRMGRDKKDLIYGDETFLETIQRNLSPFDSITISTRDKEGIGKIQDIYKDCGPLAGIHSGLVNLNSHEIFVISCDLPLMKWEYIEHLLSAYDRLSPDILVPKTDRVHPLCGIYSKNILHALEDSLGKRELKLQKFLKSQNTYYLPIKDEGFQRALEHNINTPQEYRNLVGGQNERS